MVLMIDVWNSRYCTDFTFGVVILLLEAFIYTLVYLVDIDPIFQILWTVWWCSFNIILVLVHVNGQNGISVINITGGNEPCNILVKSSIIIISWYHYCCFQEWKVIQLGYL